uniref:MADF domain-containing protein n=1 Tax=Anopheles dirus TaxID=7168 RepID=A0A182NYY9_9DIPT
KSGDYKNYPKKCDAWDVISATTCFSVAELKSKWESLRGTYRKINSKYQKSLVTGSASSDAQQPTWFAYQAMRFVAVDEAVSEDVGMPIAVELLEGECSNITYDAPAAADSRQQTPHSKTTKKKRAILDDVDVELVQTLKTLRQQYEVQEQGTNHGRYLNDILKECDPDVGDTIIIKVQEVIFEAQKEMARRRSKKTKDSGTDP